MASDGGRLKRAARKGRVIKARFVDQVRFAGALVASPKRTGAVAPTSSELAGLMASEINARSGLPVLELGPGTGAITGAILAAGVRPEDLWLIEFSPSFCRQLAAAFPGVHVIEGDAFDLRASLPADAPEVFDCVISGLPLLNFSPRQRMSLAKQALSRVPRGRPFVQFSYGIGAPLDPDTTEDMTVARSPWVFRNLPPARVWTYRHPASALS